jgi:hypothetical protein
MPHAKRHARRISAKTKAIVADWQVENHFHHVIENVKWQMVELKMEP